MKMRRLIYLFLVSAAFLCSCEKFIGPQQPIVAEGLTLSQSEVVMYPGGGTVQIMVTSGESWYMSRSYLDWVNVKDASGTNVMNGKAGSVLLELSADVNLTDETRSGSLTFRSDGREVTLKVTQDAPYLKVKHAGSWLDEEFYKGYLWYVSENKPDAEHVFSIESNTWWKITGAEDEFVFNQTEGEGDFNLTVLPKDINVSTEDNTMHITLEGPDERNKYELEFVQDYLIFILHNNTLTSCNEFGAEVSGIVVESEVDWHLTDKRNGWSVMGKDSGYGTAGSPVQTQLGTLKINPNDTRETRRHSIEFIPEDPDALSRNVTIPYVIEQDPFVFDVEGAPSPSYAFGNRDAAPEAKYLTVNASADWYVDQVPAWISLNSDTMSGKGAQGGAASELIFAPKGQNMELVQKTGVVLLKNDVNKLQVPISVVQDEFLFTTDWNSSNKLEAVPENERDEYHSFNFKTSGPWYIDRCPDWLEFQVNEGTYNDDEGIDLYFKAKSTNTADADRTGEVRLVSELHKNMGNPIYQVLSVTQNGFKFYLGESEGTEDDVLNQFSELGTETQKIKITSPTQWKSKVSNSWIHVDPKEGISGGEATVSVDMNTSTSSRTGTVSFTNNDVNNGKGKTINVVVSQAPYVFNVDFGVKSPLSLSPILDSSTSTYRVNVTSSGRWEVTSDASWVTLSSNGADKGAAFNIMVDNNLTSSKRTASVVVTNLDLPYYSNNKATLTINQEGFVFKAECRDNIEFDAIPEGQSYRITYTCTAGLKIDASSWINCVDKGNGTIEVTADNNTSNVKRMGSVKLSNSYTGDSKTFEVTQKPYEFAVSGTAYSVEHKDNDDVIVKLTSSGRWSASTDASWLSVIPGSGNGNAEIRIAVDDNTKTASRKGIVTVKSEDNSQFLEQITITQDAAPKKK
jgi:hypothetical protein